MQASFVASGNRRQQRIFATDLFFFLNAANCQTRETFEISMKTPLLETNSSYNERHFLLSALSRHLVGQGSE